MKFNWGIILAITALLGGVAAFAFSHRQIPSTPSAYSPQGESPPPVSPATSQMPGTRVYRSQALRFEVSYPEDLTVKEYKETNTTTIVFEDPTGEKGFQVFAVPYGESLVSSERFKMDVPSGVRKDPISVIIDGITATAFFSANTLFGDMREVWFIKNGFLYEVTTYKELDTWLAGIMQTWRFI